MNKTRSIILVDYYTNVLGESISVYNEENKIYVMGSLEKEYKEFTFETTKEFEEFQDFNGFIFVKETTI